MSALVLAGPIGHDAHEHREHPEHPDRVTAALDGVADLHLGSDCTVVEPVPACRRDLERVHAPAHLEAMEALALSGGGMVDADTFVLPDSWSTALLAAGAGLRVVEMLSASGEGIGLVAARPPGHHATRTRAMGFCLINNVAVTAAALADRGERVLIVDWDVHHGNGTQQIFWDDPRVLYVSTHQSPLYPVDGRAREVGGPEAAGLTVNVPLPPGATGDVVRRALEEVAAPVVDAFGPTWVLVSAGFDAHRDDPLADLALSSADFSGLAATVAGMVPGRGRLVLFLEGGYHLGALRASMSATVGTLVGSDHRSDDVPTAGGPGTDTLAGVVRAREVALDA